MRSAPPAGYVCAPVTVMTSWAWSSSEAPARTFQVRPGASMTLLTGTTAPATMMPTASSTEPIPTTSRPGRKRRPPAPGRGAAPRPDSTVGPGPGSGSRSGSTASAEDCVSWCSSCVTPPSCVLKGFQVFTAGSWGGRCRHRHVLPHGSRDPYGPVRAGPRRDRSRLPHRNGWHAGGVASAWPLAVQPAQRPHHREEPHE